MIIKSSLIGVFILLTILTIRCSDAAPVDVPIYLDYHDRFFFKELNIDSVYVDTLENSFRYFMFENNQGGCEVLEIEVNGDTLFTGKYRATGIIHEGTSGEENNKTGELEVEKINYYRPIKFGFWKFYKNGEVVRKERW